MVFSDGSVIKNLPTMQETWIWSLGWEDPLEKDMATYSSILAWRIPWTEDSGGLQSMGSQSVRHDWVTNSRPTCTHSSQQCQYDQGQRSDHRSRWDSVKLWTGPGSWPCKSGSFSDFLSWPWKVTSENPLDIKISISTLLKYSLPLFLSFQSVKRITWEFWKMKIALNE